MLRTVIQATTATEFNTGLALVEYYTPTCEPCKTLIPKLEQLAKDRPDVAVCKVDVTQAHELSRAAMVRGVPTVVVYKDGAEQYRVTSTGGWNDAVKQLK